MVRLKVVSINQSQSWSDRELRQCLGVVKGVEGAFITWSALPTLEISGGEGRQIIEVVWMINDKEMKLDAISKWCITCQ